MNKLNEISIVISSYKRAFKLVFHKKIRFYLLVPLLLNIILIAGGYALLDGLIENLSEKFFLLIEMENWTFFGSEYIDDIFLGLIRFTFNLLFFLLILLYGGFFLIIIMSPIFSILSERIESLETGNQYDFSLRRTFQDIWRGIKIAFRYGILQILFTVVILIVGFIPIIGIVAPILLFATSAYFYGISFMDFTMERHFPSLKESDIFIRKHRLAAVGIGSIFSISLFLPLCNLFLAPFIAIIAVIAATITVLCIHNNKSNENLTIFK